MLKLQTTHPTHGFCLTDQYTNAIKNLAPTGIWKAVLVNSGLHHQVTARFCKLHHRGSRLIGSAPFVNANLFTHKWQNLAAFWQQDQAYIDIKDSHGQLAYCLKSLHDPNSVEAEHLSEWFDTYAGLSAITPKTTHIKRFKTHRFAVQPIDQGQLQQIWLSFKHPQQANSLFKAQAHQLPTLFESLGNRFARSMTFEQLVHHLERLRLSQAFMSITARNEALTQTHLGRIRKLFQTDDKLLLTDAGFKLQILSKHISQAWCLKIPTDTASAIQIKLLDSRNQEVLTITDQQPCHSSHQWQQIFQQLN
ncbi:hypothetical protein THIAE_08150 [Thiomicrospira aerophila AL3]|uniref:Haemin-degrading HemS/ChuX domain-containing protein n=1 Tax=Thiomicrospira aerophila AL3 TaxID=717772 RepID=W0DV81_9GAMM|nr:hypothetical protein [Thiomicrospira aerophila]AHF02352.1 hypothetical protein THIAE_08150 [Thiomicrospira aerophila AL3]